MDMAHGRLPFSTENVKGVCTETIPQQTDCEDEVEHESEESESAGTREEVDEHASGEIGTAEEEHRNLFTSFDNIVDDNISMFESRTKLDTFKKKQRRRAIYVAPINIGNENRCGTLKPIGTTNGR